jgi:hypothetical protein
VTEPTDHVPAATASESLAELHRLGAKDSDVLRQRVLDDMVLETIVPTETIRRRTPIIPDTEVIDLNDRATRIHTDVNEMLNEATRVRDQHRTQLDALRTENADLREQLTASQKHVAQATNFKEDVRDVFQRIDTRAVDVSLIPHERCVRILRIVEDARLALGIVR